MTSVAIPSGGERAAVIVRSITPLAFLHLTGHPLGHGRDGLNIYPIGHSASTPHILRCNHSAPIAFHFPCREYSG